MQLSYAAWINPCVRRLL